MSSHLVIVTPFPPMKNSIGQYGYYLSKAIAQTGKFEHVTVITQVATDTQQFDAELPFRVERVWHLNRPDSSLKILNQLKKYKPDLVWYNLGASIFGKSPPSNIAGLLSPALSRMIGIPTVITLHELIEQSDLQALHVPGGQLASYGVSLIQKLCTQADVVCVTLRQHATYLSQTVPGVQVIHIPHGAFTSPTFLTNLPNLEILFLGYIAPFKGLELLLNVFRDLRTHHPSLNLMIAGEEHPRFPGYLKHIRNIFGEDPAICWLGYVPELDLSQIFAQATIVVLPNSATTGASSVLYRAATWGRPIVASDLPELRAVADEENLQVEFFRSGDSISLKTTLERLLMDPEQRTRQAHHNYHVIKERLTLTHICQMYLQAFELALAGHKRHSLI